MARVVYLDIEEASDHRFVVTDQPAMETAITDAMEDGTVLRVEEDGNTFLIPGNRIAMAKFYDYG